uniref:Uncharacterized protein n=1 Tax=Alexandrium andersonii TaxID=327968 RepID=A0A7S2DED8_9DINO
MAQAFAQGLPVACPVCRVEATALGAMATRATSQRLSKVALVLAFFSALGCLLPSGISSAFLAPRRSYIVADLATHTARRPGAPCRRRASKSGCAEEGDKDSDHADHPLQVPEANYFATEAALHCIEDGCPVEEVEQLYGKLERDEPRIQATIEELKESSEAAGAAEGVQQEIAWLQQFLDRSRDMREKLHGVKFSHGFDAAAELSGALGIGHGGTGGFLRMRPGSVTGRPGQWAY